EHPAGEAVAMASRCRKCGQQVPRNLPFTAVRITEGEMKSYHDFIGGCIRLERMAKKGMCSIFNKIASSPCGNCIASPGNLQKEIIFLMLSLRSQ
uniref:Uncharacterized protein n=1 Tax=Ficedula albicollis TaxID=59894 RepID=A0A803VNB4_FICAL